MLFRCVCVCVLALQRDFAGGRPLIAPRSTHTHTHYSGLYYYCSDFVCFYYYCVLSKNKRNARVCNFFFALKTLDELIYIKLTLQELRALIT